MTGSEPPSPPKTSRRDRVRASVGDVSRLNLVERRMSTFLREPPSVRLAASVIVTATAVLVVGAGALIRVLDHHEYPNIWIGMWWALQTVTTVGYGDVTPKDVAGRVVGAAVMLEGIAFLAIVTAAITSSFVARAQRERSALADEGLEDEQLRMETRLDEIAETTKNLQAMLRELSDEVKSLHRNG